MLTLLTIPAHASSYTFGAPTGAEFVSPTSDSTIYVNSDSNNQNLSKDTAIVPQNMGYTVSANVGSALNPYYGMGSSDASDSGFTSSTSTEYAPSTNVQTSTNSGNYTLFTEVTSSLYYSSGYLATLSIPSVGLSVKVYEGTDSGSLALGAGHFENTSIFDGNVCIAGHNRGVNNHFGEIHNLNYGDTITLTTQLGTKTYAVTSIEKVLETNTSMLAPTTSDQITLITCVMNESEYRWCVKGVAV